MELTKKGSSTKGLAARIAAFALSAMLVLGLVPVAAFGGIERAYAQDGNVELYPEIEQHVEDGLDEGLVGERDADNPFAAIARAVFGGEDLEPVDEVLYLRYTLADGARVQEGMEIDDVFTSDDNVLATLMGQYNTYVRMYDPGKESPYYVAMLDTTALSRAANTIDVDFARLNDYGELVDGCVYDEATGLAYIPKSLYEEDGAGEEWTLQAQALMAFDADALQNATTGVDTTVEWAGGSCKRPVWANPLDMTTKIDLSCVDGYQELALSDLEVAINDFDGSELVEGRNAAYDPATGTLEIATSPLALLKVGVTVKDAGFLAPERAYAANKYTLDTMNILPFTLSSFDTSIPVGSYFQGTTWLHYAASMTSDDEVAKKEIAPYMAQTNNGDLEWAYDCIKNGNTWDNNLTDATGWAPVTFFMTMPGASNGYSFPGIDLSSYGEWYPMNVLPLCCSHVGSAALDHGHAGSTKDGAYAAGCRVLSYSADAEGKETVTIGFITSDINSQSGCGVYRFYVEGKGDIEIVKRSANPDVTTGNACYDLSGAVYGIYSDVACTQLVETVTTDANGYGKVTVRKGYYYVKEITAPKGYALDVSVHGVNVVASQTATLNLSDLPQNDPAAMWVGKIDLETTLNMPQGSASLAGAEYTVRYYDGYYDTAEAAEESGEPTCTWVVRTDEDGFASLEDQYLVSGDKFYYNSANRVTIPLGTVLIQETKAPEGYLIGDDTVFVQKITQADSLESVETYDVPVHKEQVKRGDLEFVKASEKSQHRLANVPFRITSLTTGESHIVVTDANGEAKTKASWNSHTHRTNANDAAVNEDGTVDETKLDPEAGVWFGEYDDPNAEAPEPVEGEEPQEPAKTMVEPDDEHGALPFDTYSIEELRVSSNEGLELISIPTVVVSRDNYSIDLGTLDNQPELECVLNTVARNGIDGSKATAQDPDAKLVDRIEYRDLYAGGKSYTVKTTLMDRTTGEPVKDAEGNDVSAESKLVPEKEYGFVEVPLSFDSRDVANRDVVFFEELVDDETGKTVAEHKDLEDYGQTVHVTEVEVGTTATDAADGTKVVAASGDAAINDEIAYRNLVPGATYVATATLMEVSYDDEGNVEVGKLLVDGKPVVAAAEFTPKDSNGTVTVYIPVDATHLAGKRVVVYESIAKDGEEVANHEDPEDEGQTVTIEPMGVSTVLTGQDGTHEAKADAECLLTDEVVVENAAPGHSYTAYGMLYDRDASQPLLGYEEPAEGEEGQEPDVEGFVNGLVEALLPVEDGEEPTDVAKVLANLPVACDAASAKEFVASSELAKRVAVSEAAISADAKDAAGTLEYRIDARGLADVTAVSCVIVVDDATGEIVAAEADLACAEQSVTFVTERIGTTAYDKTDGDKQLLNSSEAVVVDKVEYENLVPGKEYVLKGTLYDKATGEPLLVADKQVTAEKSFVPAAPSGFVEVDFALDATSLDGHELVVFEKLYRSQATIEGPGEDVEVATHEDIDSESQTVKVGKPSVGSPYDKTGVSGPAFAALLVLLILSCGGVYAYYNRPSMPFGRKAVATSLEANWNPAQGPEGEEAGSKE